MPSGLVITVLPAASRATATKMARSEDQQIEFQLSADAAERAVQVIPSGLVITRLVPLAATAANNESSGDHAIPVQLFAATDVRPVQSVPFALVITPSVAALVATAQKRLRAGEYAMALNCLSTGDDRTVQLRAIRCEVINRSASTADVSATDLNSEKMLLEMKSLAKLFWIDPILRHGLCG